MNGLKLKERSVVIMDGTNKKVVCGIAKVIEDALLIRRDKFVKYRLGKNNPSTLVIKFITDDFTICDIQNNIEKSYPGLCMFDPPMTV